MKKEELRWTKRDTDAVKRFKKKLEEGRSIAYSFNPPECMMEFITVWHLKIKKDGKGNITIDVNKRKNAQDRLRYSKYGERQEFQKKFMKKHSRLFNDLADEKKP